MIRKSRIRERSSADWRGAAARRSRATIVAVLLASHLVATVVGSLPLPPQAGPAGDHTGGPPPGSPANKVGLAPRFIETDAQLRQANWAAALAELRAQEPRLAANPEYRGEWLARLALVEAGSGQSDQALWHWAVAQDLSSDLFTAEELRAFGAAGELLAGRPRRQPGEAPAGMSIERPGPGVQSAVKTQGELPQLAPGAWDPRQWLHLEILVDAQGRPRDPVVLSARSGEVAYRALEAMRGWSFEPAKKDGQPVAMLYSLVVNPPGKLALDKLMTLTAEAAAIEGKLRRQLWRQAAEEAERRWYRLLGSTGPEGAPGAERAALGMTMALRALARVGQDPKEQAWAGCRWEAAQSLLPRLYELDLSPYGPAGETVSAWRGAAFSAPFQPYSARHPQIPRLGGAVKKPQKLAAPPPFYPEAAHKLAQTGTVIIESILDVEGRVRNPVILRGLDAGDPVTFAASALDAVCDWRFQPATLDGKPVKVYYTLTVTFAIRSR
jgi:TonB family protein